MSSLAKIGIALVIIVTVALGFWHGKHDAQKNKEMSQQNTETENITLSDGTNDESLDNDMTKIDAEMNAFAKDSSAIDDGFTDKPVAQENL